MRRVGGDRGGPRIHAAAVAEPDGSISFESHLRPRWTPDPAGSGWVEVDPTLRFDGAGGVSTTATVIDLALSAGGDRALVAATDRAGRSLVLTWPERLPKPALDGATATYPGVYDGVDLQVTAGVDSFSYALVVHSARAAAQPALAGIEIGIAADGMELFQTSQGAVVAGGGNGQVMFSAARAFMWDSSSPAMRRSPAGVATVGEPWVAPDQAMLSDPAVEFPFRIFAGIRSLLANDYVDGHWRGAVHE